MFQCTPSHIRIRVGRINNRIGYGFTGFLRERAGILRRERTGASKLLELTKRARVFKRG